MAELIKGTYPDDDCVFLLQNVEHIVNPVTHKEKKVLMSAGTKSYEMIPFEYKMDTLSESLFLRITFETKERIAAYVGVLAESVYFAKGERLVLVSLARGGVPVGVLCKRYLKEYYHIDVPHYVISLIRNEGIDIAALNYILDRHPNCQLQFIDGWTGSGYISSQLKKYVTRYNEQYKQNIDCSLGVLIDSSKICPYFGTREDAIFSGCCLNATVCGMISSIYYNKAFMTENEFHGAIQWDESIGVDYSAYLADAISSSFSKQEGCIMPIQENYALQCIDLVAMKFNVKNCKNIKFGIGESTRAIIRYNLRCLLIKNIHNPDLQFLIELANTKNIEIIHYDKTDYECIALINEKEVF